MWKLSSIKRCFTRSSDWNKLKLSAVKCFQEIQIYGTIYGLRYVQFQHGKRDNL